MTMKSTTMRTMITVTTDDFYTTPVVSPEPARRRRDVMSFGHGDAFIGRVANKLDLRDRRFRAEW